MKSKLNHQESPAVKKVVIVGGGFGGISAARELAGRPEFQVQLVDRRNYHLFQPLLYQVAMAGLNPADICAPLRKLFSKFKNVEVVLAEVDQVDVKNQRLSYDGKWHPYDYLVLSCGAKHFYFGNDQWEESAPGLKTIEQATEIRRRVLMALELAEKEDCPQKRQQLLTFVIVGGGPTGLELAGAIAEMVKSTLYKDYKKADLKSTRVVLLEGGNRLISGFPENLSQHAKKSLEQMGVEVRLNCLAKDIQPGSLMANEEKIEARTVIWAAGVKPSQITATVQSPKSSDGRLIVGEDLSLPGQPNVFVVGDQAACKGSKGEYLPGLAPVAMQQGAFVGKLLKREGRGLPRKSFSYFDKGVMATIGRRRAVVQSGPFQFTGTLAWLIWVFVHIAFLIHFKNRFFVFMQWAWAYFAFGRGARLIVHKTWKFYSGEKVPID